MKTIKFTSASWHEIGSKIDVVITFYQSFTNFEITPFSENLNGIFVIFQAFPKTIQRKVLEYQIMRRKTKVLELYLILDYERIMQGSDQENLQHIKEVFVKGCETFLKPLKGFRWEEFEEKLKQVL